MLRLSDVICPNRGVTRQIFIGGQIQQQAGSVPEGGWNWNKANGLPADAKAPTGPLRLSWLVGRVLPRSTGPERHKRFAPCSNCVGRCKARVGRAGSAPVDDARRRRCHASVPPTIPHSPPRRASGPTFPLRFACVPRGRVRVCRKAASSLPAAPPSAMPVLRRRDPAAEWLPPPPTRRRRGRPSRQGFRTPGQCARSDPIVRRPRSRPQRRRPRACPPCVWRPDRRRVGVLPAPAPLTAEARSEMPGQPSLTGLSPARRFRVRRSSARVDRLHLAQSLEMEWNRQRLDWVV